MFKNLVYPTLFLGLASGAFASEELYRTNQKAYYAEHPAAIAPAQPTLAGLSADLFSVVVSYLPVADRLSLYSVDLAHRAKRFQMFNYLRSAYQELGENYDDVFLSIDHPKWQPEAGLPDDVRFKLHFVWYYGGKKLLERYNAQPEDQRDPKLIRKSFLSFYNAGCLGHVLAGREAGNMLLNPALNKVLPLIVTWADLDPDARTWDISRLNEEFLDPKFAEIWDALKGFDLYSNYTANLQSLNRFKDACTKINSGYITNRLHRKLLKKLMLSVMEEEVNLLRSRSQAMAFEVLEGNSFFQEDLSKFMDNISAPDQNVQYVKSWFHLETTNGSGSLEEKEAFYERFRTIFSGLKESFLNSRLCDLESNCLCLAAYDFITITIRNVIYLDQSRNLDYCAKLLGREWNKSFGYDLMEVLSDQFSQMSEGEKQPILEKAKLHNTLGIFLTYLSSTRHENADWSIARDFGGDNASFVFKPSFEPKHGPKNPERFQMLKDYSDARKMDKQPE